MYNTYSEMYLAQWLVGMLHLICIYSVCTVKMYIPCTLIIIGVVWQCVGANHLSH